jgi:hypothetical protein
MYEDVGDIHIIDNCLLDKDFSIIKNTMLGSDFPWYLCPTKVLYNKESIVEDKYNYQFTHIFYNNSTVRSDWFNIISPLVNLIVMPGKTTELVRIKANLLPATHDIILYDYHTDIDYSSEYDNFEKKTVVFYVNTNNGFTQFEDGTKVESIENRLVTFDTNIMHTGSSCTDQRTRCVINLNYVYK